MSNPAASPPPPRGALGPPPSLDGLSALLGEGSSKSGSGSNERASNGSMAKSPSQQAFANGHRQSQPPRPLPQPSVLSSPAANQAYAKGHSTSSSSASPTHRYSSMSDGAQAKKSGNGASSTSSSLLSPNHPDNLRKQAKTYLDPGFSVKSYVGAANALLEKARSSDAQGQAEQAFVNYLKAADVATQLPKHAEWPRIVEERGATYLRYQDFMKNVPDIIQRGHRLEDLLKAREEARAKEAERAVREQQISGLAYKEQDLEGAVGGTDAVTDQQAAEGAPSTQFDSLANRLGALRMSKSESQRPRGTSQSQRSSASSASTQSDLDHRDHAAPSSYQRALEGLPDEKNTSRRGSLGTPARLASPQLEKSGFAGITDGVVTGPDMQPTHIPTPSEFNKSYPTLDDFEARQSSPPPSAVRPPLPIPPSEATPSQATTPKASSRPPLPPLTKREIAVEDLFPMLFPGYDTIADPQLGQKIVKRAAPRILILDARTRTEWEYGFIKGADVVCVDPSKLRNGMDVAEISEALSSSWSAAEKRLFQSRNAYDLIVICDREGKSVAGSLEIVYRAISMDEGRKAPSRNPTFLLGGIERWSRKVGEQNMQRVRAPPPEVDSSTKPGHTPRQPSNASQNDDLRTKRQGIYVPSQGPPAALVPGSAAGRNRNGSFPASPSFDMLDSPSMPPRTYQGAGSGGYVTSNVTRQPGLPNYGGANTPSFEYPQLIGAQTPKPYSNGALSTPTPPPAAAGINGASARTAMYEGAQPSLDATRRPTMPPPGGAPVNVRQYSRVVPRLETNVRVGLTGLKNVGNSCYMNSTLQCLSATIPLARFFLDGSYKRAINRVNPLGTQGALAEAFAQLIRVLWSEQYTFVSPVTFREAITRFAPAFRGYDQHDAQEFLAFLLDGLHEDLNYVKQKPPPVEMTPERENELEMLPQQVASVKEWAIYRERNDSLIVDWFQGQFRNKLTCLTCGKTSTTYNAFLYLSLPIPPVPRGSGNKVTLAQCLDAFTRDEVLDKADAWHCPRCNKPRRATKKLTISRLPQVLLIHLKRFSFKGPFTDKIETNVTFPTSNLDLTNYMPPPLPPGTVPKNMPISASQQPPYVYDLYGTTHHFGSLSGGHYTATVRTQGDNGETQWKYCDDSRISNYDERQIHSPSSYILWWNRKGR